ncbi:hypothetical protein [Pelagovum pacificum]|uniref:hypothetical protein n=1 Tax=Pelagovum pacificum TaxID=2588711 RepID=UPI0018CF7B4C|nr:hypothetical protein [Pelagovum pacificum]QQA41526.1 hypothetical protein I8N54_11885 [Pelagovum pacificum]
MHDDPYFGFRDQAALSSLLALVKKILTVLHGFTVGWSLEHASKGAIGEGGRRAAIRC